LFYFDISCWLKTFLKQYKGIFSEDMELKSFGHFNWEYIVSGISLRTICWGLLIKVFQAWLGKLIICFWVVRLSAEDLV